MISLLIRHHNSKMSSLPRLDRISELKKLPVLLLIHQQLELYYESWKNVSTVRCIDLSTIQYKCVVTWNTTEQEPIAARTKRAITDPLSSFLDANLGGVLIDKAKQNNITAPVIVNNSGTVSTSTETVTNSTGNQVMTTDVSIQTQESTTHKLTTLPSTRVRYQQQTHQQLQSQTCKQIQQLIKHQCHLLT